MNKTLRSYHLINRLLIIILFLFTSSVISSATIQVISSDELKYSNDSMDGTFSNVYAPVKNINVNYTIEGSIRVSFTLECGGAGCGSVSGLIYKTGVPVGTVSTTGGTTAFSEDLLVYLTPFDNLTIYGKVNQGG